MLAQSCIYILAHQDPQDQDRQTKDGEKNSRMQVMIYVSNPIGCSSLPVLISLENFNTSILVNIEQIY